MLQERAFCWLCQLHTFYDPSHELLTFLSQLLGALSDFVLAKFHAVEIFTGIRVDANVA